MATFNGTPGNDSWTVITGGEYNIDGHDGIDTLDFGIEPRSYFNISLAADGSINVDTISGASEQMHATLKNVEKLVFNSGFEVIDLTTYFDHTPPTLASSTPAAGATSVSTGADIVLNFSEAIQAGSGTVTLQNAAGQTVETYTVGSSPNLTVSGTKLTVNPTADLAAGTGYTLTVSGGAVKDTSGNALAAAASVSFTTDAKVTVGAGNAPLGGTAGNDTLIGDARANVFIGSAGTDSIDGGAGIDKLQLSGARAGYTVTVNGTSATVADASGNVAHLANVERVQFADATIALDIAGSAGQVYRLYQAAFNRVPDSGGLGFWISASDKGQSLGSIAQGFVTSAEFQAVYGANPTSTAIVTTMYTNVLHRAPDNAGIAFWVSVLDNHSATPADVLMGFSESAENQQALAPVIGNGFPYTPFG
jgi:methionine-rich copper-binding protein CopC